MLNMLFMQSSGKQECHCRKKKGFAFAPRPCFAWTFAFHKQGMYTQRPDVQFFYASSDSSLISFLFLS